MATRKTTDDPAARRFITEEIADRTVAAADAEEVVSLFRYAQFETVTSRVGGEDVEMRRVVLTGPWEVAK